MKRIILMSIMIFTLATILSGSAPAFGETLETFFNNPEDEGLEFTIQEEFIKRIGEASATIDLCCYDLTDETVRDALIAWHDGSSQIVRVVTDNEYDTDVTSRWQLYIQPLVDDGIDVEYDIDSSIMHNKFAIIDGTAIWTGSWNLTEAASEYQWNNAIVLSGNAALVAGFQDEFDQMMGTDGTMEDGLFHEDKTQVEGSFDFNSDGTTDYYRMSPQNTDSTLATDLDGDSAITTADLIIQEIDATISGDTIYFAIYSFTSSEVATALQNAYDRSVGVHGIFDLCSAATSTSSQYTTLQAYGLNVFTLTMDSTSIAAYVHNKYMVINPDGSDPVVITGSANWSNNGITGTSNNDENLIILHDENVPREYYENWEEMARYSTDGPVETSTDVVINEIMPNPATDYWTEDGTGSTSDSYNEYFELYNTGTVTADVSGWRIYNDGTHILTINATDATRNVPPGGHILITKDDTYAESGGTNIAGCRSAYTDESSGWGLTNTPSSDYTISITNRAEVEIDSEAVPAGSYGSDIAYYRYPDGGTWTTAASSSEASPTGFTHNYIVNSEADDGLNDWTCDYADIEVGEDSGDNVFEHSDGHAFQDIDVSGISDISTGACTITISADMKCETAGCDDGNPYIYGYLIGTSTDPEFINTYMTTDPVSDTSWTNEEVSYTIPADTQTIRIFMKKSCYVSPASTNGIGFFDSIVVTIDCGSGACAPPPPRPPFPPPLFPRPRPPLPPPAP
jgi:phosphatidylserine/phosphatidylglycerophosphate/cardiolipin synthase-like enzyme